MKSKIFKMTPNRLLWMSLIWICLDFSILGKFSYVATGDNAEIVLPGLMAHSNAAFDTGLWHVFSASGDDRLAQGFFGDLSVWVFQLFPGWLANQILATCQTAAALVGIYLLAIRLGLNPLVGLFSGCLYAIGEADGVLVGSADAYLPLLVLVLSETLETPRSAGRWIVLVAVAFVYASTAYISMLMPFTPMVFFIWFAVLERRMAVRDWLIIGGVTTFLVLVRAQDFLALVYMAPLSARHLQLFGYDSPEAIRHTVQGFFISNWVSWLATGLTIFAALHLKTLNSTDRRMLLLLVSAVGLVMLSLLLKPYLVNLYESLRSYNLVRAMNYFKFVWVLCAGVGFQVLWRQIVDEGSRRRMFGQPSAKACVAAAAIVVVFIYSAEKKYLHIKDWISQGSYVNNFESPIIQKVAKKLAQLDAPYRALSFQMYPNYLNAYGIESTGGYMALHAHRFQNFWTKIVSRGARDFAPSVPNEFFRLGLFPAGHRADWPLDKMYNVNLLSMANTKYFISRDKLAAPSLYQISGPDRPWSTLNTLEKIKTNLADNFNGRRHLYVYENKNVFPRFYMAETIRLYSSVGRLLADMEAADLAESRQTAYLEQSSAPADLDPKIRLSRAEVRLEAYSSDQIVLRVKPDGVGLLIVSNPYSPYWRVWIDGRESKIFPANHAFWGVSVPKEAREVRFYYDPPHRLLRNGITLD